MCRHTHIKGLAQGRIAVMNSFETDIKRAFCSVNFLAGLLIECIILWRAGFESELFQISVPVLASLPYSTAWLSDYQSGYIKEYLPRCGRTSYILGKFLACGISGGGLLTAACLFRLLTGGEDMEWKLLLIFLSGMLWAVVAAALAAAANSRYVAYGGGFVLFYMLVILYQRYFKTLYCLYPVEWYAPEHTWVLGDTGVVLLLAGMILLIGILYYEILGRCIKHV